MQTTMTGNAITKSKRRMAGTYQIAYSVTTPSGKTGTALFCYEYDKRDIIDESLYTTPEIADEVREYVGDESPSAYGSFAFPAPENENQNGEAVNDAYNLATIRVYGYEG